MRIAILSSNFIRLPPEPRFVPKGYSGAPEFIMYTIAEELRKRGHTITVFASGDSKVSGTLVSVTKKSTSMDPAIGIKDHVDYEYLLISKCFEQAKTHAFDIIHSIFEIRSAMFAGSIDTPVVSTIHSPIEGKTKAILSQIPNTQWYVSVSNSQRRSLPSLRYAETIYHGLDPDEYPMNGNVGSYLMMAGRMEEQKGIADGLKAGLSSGVPVYLLGEPIEHDPYWQKEIQGLLDGKKVVHIGFIPKEKLKTYYAQAKAFLMPIRWEEPFGLVMIEAMACGTPVIAYNRGSVPEVIKDGVTGFIIDPDNADRPGKGSWIIKKQGVDGLVEAIKRIGEINRVNCRKHIEDHFTLKKMIDSYEQVYAKICGVKLIYNS